MKLCINCKYITYTFTERMCSYPTNLSPVDGKPELTCRQQRIDTIAATLNKVCGLDGQWFQDGKATP